MAGRCLRNIAEMHPFAIYVTIGVRNQEMNKARPVGRHAGLGWECGPFIWG